MIDYTNDYLQWDNPEAVTLTTIRGGNETETAISHALQGDASRSLLRASGISIQGDEILWLIPVALMPANTEINQGDQIEQESGVAWSVLAAKQKGIGSQATHWECVCRRLVA